MNQRRDKSKDTVTLRWLWRKTRGQRLRCLALILLDGTGALVSVAMALISKELIDSATGGDGRRLMTCIGIMLAVLLGSMALSIVESALGEFVTGRMGISFQQELLRVLLQKNYAGVARYHSGELLNRMFSDVGVVVGGVTGLPASAAYLAFRLIGAAAALLLLAPQLALIFLAVGSLVCLVMTLLRGLLKSLHKRVQEAQGAVRSFLQEALGSLLVTKVFRAEERVLARSAEFQERYFSIRMKRRMLSLMGGVGFGLIFQAGYFLTMAWGCWQILAGAVSFGTLSALLQLVSQIQSPFSGFSSLISQYFSALASAERLMELEDLPDEAHREEENPAAFHEERERLYKALRTVSFERVDFSYGRNPVLENASFQIEKGDFVSVTGLSGGGKSTLFLLLLGAYQPTAGHIHFQMADPDKPELEPGQDVRKLFAYVPQGNYLFSGTLRENVTFFRKDVEDSAVWAALRTACADSFIQELPEGLDTVLGEHGCGLSEGQMQRVAVARAILSGAPVLLLDEATSALDESTEAMLLKNIAALRSRTCVIVTHRKAALEICNRHLVIEDTHVSE